MNLRSVNCLLAACLASLQAKAQSYEFANGQLPSGNPNNNSYTENIDFADVDLDGDMDCVNADGGDIGDDQNRLWLNLGFAQSGTIGFFQDETATRFPDFRDSTRDMDFVDLDNDGDQDLFTSNHSGQQSQPNRFWINMGGTQAGSAGFYQDQTNLRWLGIAVNNGSTECSSIPSSSALAGGGFMDWSGDSVFGDLDNDGDLDLVQSTYGPQFVGNAPQHLFLNDGTGKFKEHNPSCFQLTGADIPDGSPALWAQGTQQDNTLNSTGVSADIDNSPLGVEIGDLDGDYDIDFVIGSRNNPPQRMFRNMKVELGTLIWRDVTMSQMVSALATGNDNYEQEFGDFDNDSDLDLYGLNYPGLVDAVYKNNGAGVWGTGTNLAGSSADDNEGDFLDFNNDGNLDIFVGNFSGQDKLYQGDGAGGYSFGSLPADSSETLGQDSCDIDLDGDYDLILGNNAGQPNTLLKNVTGVADAVAATLANVQQAPDRAPSTEPTVILAQVYENASWDVLRYNTVTLRYQLNGGAIVDEPMRFVGGQLFRGEIPGTLVGTIGYQVTSQDEHGNFGLSATKSYLSDSSVCTGSLLTYCTAKTSSIGCIPAINGLGTPSLAAPGSFFAQVTLADGMQNGLMYFGVQGQASAPFFGGTLCVGGTLYRLGVKNSGGTMGTCSGSFSTSLSGMLAEPSGGPLLVVGQTVNAQQWYRDPPSVGLSNGLQFVICP